MLGARSTNTNQNTLGSCCPWASTSRSVCVPARWERSSLGWCSHLPRVPQRCCWTQRMGGVCLCCSCCEAKWRKCSVLPPTRALTVFPPLYSQACEWPVPQIKYFLAPHCREYLLPPHSTQNISNPGVRGSCKGACWESSRPQQGQSIRQGLKPPGWVQHQSRMCDRVSDKGRKMLPALLVGDHLRTAVAGQAQRGMCPLLYTQSWLDAAELRCRGTKHRLRNY